DFYYRILRGWPGTGMENFGERLSVDDIWRVVLFVKTIPNGTLKKSVVPEPKDYITWQPSKELIAWLQEPEADRQRRLRQEGRDRPVHAGGDARVPGPRSRRSVLRQRHEG